MRQKPWAWKIAACSSSANARMSPNGISAILRNSPTGWAAIRCSACGSVEKRWCDSRHFADIGARTKKPRNAGLHSFAMIAKVLLGSGFLGRCFLGCRSGLGCSDGSLGHDLLGGGVGARIAIAGNVALALGGLAVALTHGD